MTGFPHLEFDDDLPISAWRDEIVDAIKENQVLILAGETGSGKTTQLPKMCLLAGRFAIGHTQPRRIAARSVAERIAEEMRVELGELVGYQVRFTRKASKDTRIKVMTDGVLLNEIGLDRDLKRYDTIIIDEAHERSLNIDFLLGYLKQLCVRRPDLKVIVTSATIDTERFSQHFDGAPIIEVSGRTYPVEIRYRPLYDDQAEADGVATVLERDQTQGIIDAVNELSGEGSGDILVFLSGEREIRDTADALNALNLRFTEVIPLYARLSAAEQHKVFSAHTGRRIVLSTNVAETSLTVPGIRYVIDAGMARISRYSSKTKVQRLPVEPISQASANQRSGRCGRVAAGIAIRLYSQTDFAARPEFTEPEILRTNLASVILQMAEARLGAIEDFPFVEAPDRSQINDGVRLLDELGALAPGIRVAGKMGAPTLTTVGRQLARIPVDPRLGRMIIEAQVQDCLREVLIIVAGLSVQDPRERPHEAQEEADLSHRRFFSDAVLDATPAPVQRDTRGRIKETAPTTQPAGSDFLAYLRMWDYLAAKRKELSGNAYRRLCRDEFLNYVRLRDWQDLYAQLRDVAIDLRLTPHERTHGKQRSDKANAAKTGGQQPKPTRAEKLVDDLGSRKADPASIHTAILSGLLSHVGLADVKQADPTMPARKRIRLGPREYTGARGARFALNRGSSLAKNPPPLVMAFELVETTRLWARTVAEIEPTWVEKVGEHLLKRSYSEPHWSSKNGAAMAYEKITLLGVPIVADRLVHYGKINPVEARDIFIQSALVEGQWHTRHHFFTRNQDVREQAEEMEHRTRRRSIVVDDGTLFDFYAARIPAEVTSQTHFDTWWRKQRHIDEFYLDLSIDDLVDPDEFDEGAFPDDWDITTDLGPLQLPISYVFDPGSGHDGVNVAVPLNVLNQIRPEPFTWQVPGLREELATELIRALPKNIRTSFVPAPDFARKALDWLAAHPHQAVPAFSASLGKALHQLTGHQIPDSAWNHTGVPAHLTVTFVVVNADKEVARGTDITQLAQAHSRQLSKQLTQAAKTQAKRGATTWVFGTMPAETSFTKAGSTVVGYPALVDEGSTVGSMVYDTAVRQQDSHRRGLRRLVALNIPDLTKWVVTHMTMQQKINLAASPYPTVPALLADARLASIGHLIDAQGERGQVRNETEFSKLCATVRQDHAVDFQQVVATTSDALGRLAETRTLLARLGKGDAIADMTEQLNNLFFNGFIAATPQPWFAQLPRYVHAVGVRAQNLRANPARDTAALDVIMDLEDEYAELCDAQPQGPLPSKVAEIGWLIEELRVSLFAQTLGTRIPVSAKRIRSAMAQTK